MNTAVERRLLQAGVALACDVPICGGMLGIIGGAGMIGHGGDVTLDSHVRYLSGLLFGLGLCFFVHPSGNRKSNRAVHGTECHRRGRRVVAGLWSGGRWLARGLDGVCAGDGGVVPLLFLWQRRIAHRSGG